MKTVTELEVTDYKLDCPHCGAGEYGFGGDARGETFTCDSCGEEYKIHSDADFEMI